MCGPSAHTSASVIIHFNMLWSKTLAHRHGFILENITNCITISKMTWDSCREGR